MPTAINAVPSMTGFHQVNRRVHALRGSSITITSTAFSTSSIAYFEAGFRWVTESETEEVYWI